MAKRRDSGKAIKQREQSYDVLTAGESADGTAELTVVDEKTKTRRDAIVADALVDFRTSAIAETDLRLEQAEDNRMMAGIHWDPALKAMRDQDLRPVITINRLIQFRNQTTNNVRQNRPAIAVNPMDGAADKDTAEVIQGIVRHAETMSSAPVQYDTALEMAVTVGRGYLWLENDWVGDTFEQEISIKAAQEFEAVYLDPSYTEFDAADATFAFILHDELRDEYERRWGALSPVASIEKWAVGAIGRRYKQDWLPKGRVRIAKYYWLDEVHEDRHLVTVTLPAEDGEAIGQSEQALIWDSQIKPMEDLGSTITILKTRKGTKKTVRWALMNAIDVLEEGVCPGKRIPIVPVVGNMMMVDGRRDFFGMVRAARDPMRMYNVWVSAETESIALAPRSPFIVAIGQIKGFEDIWREANRRNYAFLPYHPKVQGDVLVPPPQRNQFEPPINAIMAAVRQADNDLKAVTGIYDASLGERGPQESGKAIGARKIQGEVANFNFVDNLGRAMTSLGRLMLDWIPVVYDTAQMRRIVGIDNKPKTVISHAGNKQAAEALLESDQALEQGIERVFDLSMGRYDVVVTTGASFESRRAESVEFMQKVIQAYPMLIEKLGDLVFEEMDTPGAAKMADRLKKLLPPELQEAKPGEQKDEGGPDPAQIKQIVEGMAKDAEAMMARIKELEAERDTKALEVLSRERIAEMNNKNRLAVEAMRADNRQAMSIMQAESAKTAQGQAESHAMMRQILTQLHGTMTKPDPSAAPQPTEAAPQSPGPNGPPEAAPDGSVPPQ